jgi:hypothetical protein
MNRDINTNKRFLPEFMLSVDEAVKVKMGL